MSEQIVKTLKENVCNSIEICLANYGELSEDKNLIEHIAACMMVLIENKAGEIASKIHSRLRHVTLLQAEIFEAGVQAGRNDALKESQDPK